MRLALTRPQGPKTSRPQVLFLGRPVSTARPPGPRPLLPYASQGLLDARSRTCRGCRVADVTSACGQRVEINERRPRARHKRAIDRNTSRRQRARAGVLAIPASRRMRWRCRSGRAHQLHALRHQSWGPACDRSGRLRGGTERSRGRDARQDAKVGEPIRALILFGGATLERPDWTHGRWKSTNLFGIRISGFVYFDSRIQSNLMLIKQSIRNESRSECLIGVGWRLI